MSQADQSKFERGSQSGPRDRYPADRPRAATVRSRLMLEVASELVGRGDFEPKQARIQLRAQGADSWSFALFGSDALSAAQEVGSGETAFAIVNPATIVTKATRGDPPFSEPIPLQAIATIPSHDQLGVAIADGTGITSFEELLARKPSLRVSLRGGRPDHSVHLVAEDVLRAVGTSTNELTSWGGELQYHMGLPHREPRRSAIEVGQVDLIIDEGIYNWVDLAVESGYRFLSIPSPALSALEASGYRPAVIAASDYAKLTEDVATVDFSGFLIYTHKRVSDDLVTAFCEAIVQRKHRIPWQGGGELPLHRMIEDAEDAPVPISFHPAAEAFWSERGYLR